MDPVNIVIGALVMVAVVLWAIVIYLLRKE